MPAFEFPDYTLIAYGKTGSTSLTVLSEQRPYLPPHIVKTSQGQVWEPVLGIDWNSLPDKPVYLVMRPPLERLLSGIQMFLMVRYCDQMILSRDLSRKWAEMNPEPNPYKAHFLRTIKELWSTEEFWCEQIPVIFSLFCAELFNEHSSLQEYLRSEPGGLTPEQADNRLKVLLNSHGIAGDFYSCWEDLFSAKLMEERYHMGNYLTYCDTSRLSGWIPLSDLSDWHELQPDSSHRISKENPNKSRGFHIAPGSLWKHTDEQHIISAMQKGIQNCSIWWLWQRYLIPENIAWGTIRGAVPQLGLEPAAPHTYTPPDITSNQ